MELINVTWGLTEWRNEVVNERIEQYIGYRQQDYAHYIKQRNATSPEENDRIGKKGEFIAYDWLFEQLAVGEGWFAERGYSLTGFADPDTSWHPVGQKSFAADLGCFHVKTAGKFQDQLSWTFQRGNESTGGGRDPLLNGADETPIVFVEWLDGHKWDSAEARVSLIARPAEIIPYLRPPIVPKLRRIKTCLYFADVEQLFSVPQHPED